MERNLSQDIIKMLSAVKSLFHQIDSTMEQMDCFNLFSCLLKEKDEVRLHSRFLSSSLDPKGKHNMGKLPLQLFLKAINSKMKVEKDVEVYPSSSCWTEYKHIDIFIIDRKQQKALILENKIGAKDGEKQLDGYFNHCILFNRCIFA